MKQFLLSLLFISPLYLFSNNIQVSNVSVVGQVVTFDLSWENSWNTMNNINPLYPNNWDAAWIFVKYQSQIDNLWKHAKLTSTPSDHSVTNTPVLSMELTADNMGVFIHRTSPGSGNISAASVSITLDALISPGPFNFKVFGTEMVLVPQDAFEYGDGNVSGVSYLTPGTVDASVNSAGFAAGALYPGSPAVPNTFPLGFEGFYMMKYEVSNEQYVDFLNTLTYDQQATRQGVAPNAAAGTKAFATNYGRQVIEIQTPGLNNTQPAVFACERNDNDTYNEDGDGQNMAFNCGGMNDMLAFLDWSGLRPFSELEFEKASRGTLARVQNGYAWGSTNLNCYTYASMTDATKSSAIYGGTVVNGMCNCNSGNASHGPNRVGIFASATSGRESAGASFYGVMDLSGNLWETPLIIIAANTSFDAQHGDGTLLPIGDPDVNNWPSSPVNTFLNKGGSWFETTSHSVFLRTSYRTYNTNYIRSWTMSIRGARTAQ